MRGRCITIFDIRVQTYTTAMYTDPHNRDIPGDGYMPACPNRIYIGARRRKPCQLSNGLNNNLQPSKADAAQKISSPGDSWPLVKVFIFEDAKWFWWVNSDTGD